MSQRGLLYDHIAAAWATLTPEQRICWHFTAADRPISLADGELFSETGWQYFVDKNSALAVIDPALMLTDAPTNNEPPATPEIETTAWKLPAKLGSGGSTRRPPPIVRYKFPTLETSPSIVTQEYTAFLGPHNTYPTTQRITAVDVSGQHWIVTGTPGEYLTTGVSTGARPIPPSQSKKPAVRHVVVRQDSDPLEFDLTTPNGYFATTGGSNKFASIKGMTARRRPDLPLGKAKFVNIRTGRILEKSIPNPTGGSRSIISRNRHFP